MEIKNTIPPIYYKLQDKFGVKWNDIIIAYAPDIYAPKSFPKQKEVHEAIHIMRQQEIGVDIWWGMYLENKDFRLAEELIAYKAEIEWIKQKVATRTERRLLMKHIYKSLASSVYDLGITEDYARYLLS